MSSDLRVCNKPVSRHFELVANTPHDMLKVNPPSVLNVICAMGLYLGRCLSELLCTSKM